MREGPPPGTLHVRVGCELVYDSPHASPMLAIVQPGSVQPGGAQPGGGPLQRVLEEVRVAEVPGGPAVPLREYTDPFGNRVWRLLAPAGPLRLRYDALVEVPATSDPVLPDLPKTPVENLPDETIPFTLPSRHSQSDLFLTDAWRLFGHIPGGWAQAQAVCDWLHENVAYEAFSTSTTSGYEAYQARRGVCRDFAHLGVSFCRALNMPARYVAGYLPDIGVEPDPRPMDFHAWFEVFLDGAWRTFDARHNRPRTGRVLIGRGRDAVDLAFSTTYGGTRLQDMKVWAEPGRVGEVAPA